MILTPTFNMLGYTAYVISSTAFIILGIFLMSLRVMEKEMAAATNHQGLVSHGRHLSLACFRCAMPH